MSAEGRRLVVEADGGSRGNPGVAGYGAVVRDGASGTLIAERAAPLGKQSNNVAEYSGLLAGLQAVLDLDLADGADVHVRLDSKLVVEQMSGRWKIKHEDMRRLALQARDLVRQIEWAGGSVRFEWIPREQNKAADALSNDGMDGKTVVRDHVSQGGKDGGTRDSDAAGDANGDADGHVRVAEGGGPTRARRAEGASASERPGPPTTTPASTTLASTGLPAPTFGEGRAPLADVVLSTETTPTLEGSCRLVLVRHGITAYTAAGKLDGRGGADPELNETGLRQAQAAAGAVKALVDRSEQGPVVVLTSSLRRAKQTGQAVAKALGVDPEEDRDWDEQGFGDWDGQAMGDLVAEKPEELLRLRQDPAYARPGGESREMLVERVKAALGRAVARGGTVIVASHRMPILAVLAEVLGIDPDRVWSLATAPTSLTALEVWPDGGVQVAFVNDTHHLHGLV